MKRVIKSAESTDRLIAKHILERYSDDEKHYVAECIEEIENAYTDMMLADADNDEVEAALQAIRDEWIQSAVADSMMTEKEFNEIYNALQALED